MTFATTPAAASLFFRQQRSVRSIAAVASFQAAAEPGRERRGVRQVWQYAQSPRRPEMTAACRQTYARR